jgi:NhaP-type Na+/H+ or K+/H+ antiporter
MGHVQITLILIALCLLGFALVRVRLASTVVTGPMIFAGVGLLVGGSGLGIISLEGDTAVTVVNIVLQATLALVIFTDASALHISSWRKDADLPARLLGIGLPLTIVVGWIVAALVLTDLTLWEAAVLGTIVSPTDAALGKAVISNPRVPERIRNALDIESGLNDGIALPFLLVFLAFADTGVGGSSVGATFLQAIGAAVVAGVVIAALGGWLLVRSKKLGWIDPNWSAIAVVAIALLAFLVASGLGGSGFIAVFVAGLTFGEMTRGHLEDSAALAVGLGSALTQVSFLIFGALVLGPAVGAATVPIFVAATLMLTIVRMGPVALSLIGTKLKWPTIAYMGWFGPRGLSTIVYGALIVAQSDLAGTPLILTVAGVTVGMSILLHGLTANPGATAYANWFQKTQRHGETAEGKHLHQPLKRPRMGSAHGAGGDTT